MNSSSGFAVHLDVGKKIIGLANKDSHARRVALNYLRELQQTVKTKRKSIRSYFLAVDALGHQYERRVYSSRQLAQRLESDFGALDAQHTYLAQQKQQKEQDIKALDKRLRQARDYAQRRRDKKARREREYNHFYFMPLVNHQYKRKYIRARDKNADAEQQVSEVRLQLDASQDALHDLCRAIGQQKLEHTEAKEKQKEAEAEMARLEKQLAHLRDGQSFWGQFDSQQITLFLEASQHLIQALKADQCPEDHWAKTFQMVCLEYGDSEDYGDQRWTDLRVDFDCARCHALVTGWPTVDKVRTSDLLCADCYQVNRTSMIVEKKMNVFGEKLGLDRSENRRQSATSRLSSHTPLLNDARPIVKKMFKNVFTKPTAVCAQSQPSLQHITPSFQLVQRTHRRELVA